MNVGYESHFVTMHIRWPRVIPHLHSRGCNSAYGFGPRVCTRHRAHCQWIPSKRCRQLSRCKGQLIPRGTRWELVNDCTISAIVGEETPCAYSGRSTCTCPSIHDSECSTCIRTAAHTVGALSTYLGHWTYSQELLQPSMRMLEFPLHGLR